MIKVLARAGIFVFALVALVGCKGPGEQTPADAPTQPIAFYHSVHAGDNQIPCMYCHNTADRSTSAGVPSVKLCVGCHVPGSAVLPPEQAQLAFPTADRDSLWNAEATKLVGYWQRQEAIPWVRIHQLPKHVQFPHKMHIRVGLQCQTCHGPVQEMDQIYQFSSLQMGWCIECHRGERELSEAESQSIQERSTFVREVVAMGEEGEDLGGHEGTYPNQIATTDCVACHF